MKLRELNTEQKSCSPMFAFPLGRAKKTHSSGLAEESLSNTAIRFRKFLPSAGGSKGRIIDPKRPGVNGCCPDSRPPLHLRPV